MGISSIDTKINNLKYLIEKIKEPHTEEERIDNIKEIIRTCYEIIKWAKDIF